MENKLVDISASTVLGTKERSQFVGQQDKYAKGRIKDCIGLGHETLVDLFEAVENGNMQDAQATLKLLISIVSDYKLKIMVAM
jgi:hypothetical protein